MGCASSTHSEVSSYEPVEGSTSQRDEEDEGEVSTTANSTSYEEGIKKAICEKIKSNGATPDDSIVPTRMRPQRAHDATRSPGDDDYSDPEEGAAARRVKKHSSHPQLQREVVKPYDKSQQGAAPLASYTTATAVDGTSTSSSSAKLSKVSLGKLQAKKRRESAAAALAEEPVQYLSSTQLEDVNGWLIECVAPDPPPPPPPKSGKKRRNPSTTFGDSSTATTTTAMDLSARSISVVVGGDAPLPPPVTDHSDDLVVIVDSPTTAIMHHQNTTTTDHQNHASSLTGTAHGYQTPGASLQESKISPLSSSCGGGGGGANIPATDDDECTLDNTAVDPPSLAVPPTLGDISSSGVGLATSGAFYSPAPLAIIRNGNDDSGSEQEEDEDDDDEERGHKEEARVPEEGGEHDARRTTTTNNNNTNYNPNPFSPCSPTHHQMTLQLKLPLQAAVGQEEEEVQVQAVNGDTQARSITTSSPLFTGATESTTLGQRTLVTPSSTPTHHPHNTNNNNYQQHQQLHQQSAQPHSTTETTTNRDDLSVDSRDEEEEEQQAEEQQEQEEEEAFHKTQNPNQQQQQGVYNNNTEEEQRLPSRPSFGVPAAETVLTPASPPPLLDYHHDSHADPTTMTTNEDPGSLVVVFDHATTQSSGRNEHPSDAQGRAGRPLSAQEEKKISQPNDHTPPPSPAQHHSHHTPLSPTHPSVLSTTSVSIGLPRHHHNDPTISSTSQFELTQAVNVRSTPAVLVGSSNSKIIPTSPEALQAIGGGTAPSRPSSPPAAATDRGHVVNKDHASQ